MRHKFLSHFSQRAPALNDDVLDLYRPKKLCEEFDRFFDFGEHHAIQGPTCEPAINGKNFQNTVKQIEKIIEKAKDDIRLCCDDLETHLDELIVSSATESEHS